MLNYKRYMIYIYIYIYIINLLFFNIFRISLLLMARMGKMHETENALALLGSMMMIMSGTN